MRQFCSFIFVFNLMFFIIFFILLPIWLIFSGIYDFFHISMGVISCIIVAYISKDLYKLPKNNSFFKNFLIFLNLIFYFPWIVFEIIKANLNVADIILSRNIIDAIDPEIITFKTKLNNKLSRVIFANSITLTPGTVTMSLYEDELIIHALSSKGAIEGIAKIENKLLRVFKQEVA